MCLATAYVENKGQEEEVMRDVAWIEPGSAGLRLGAFLGESKLFQARIKYIDLVHNSIILSPISERQTENTVEAKASQ